MPVSGPTLPPHLLAKRKRDDASDDGSDSSSDEEGPQPATDTAKKRRVAGPAPPPAPLDERPTGDPSDDGESSSDDDSYGPSLPQAGQESDLAQQASVFDSPSHAPKEEQQKTKRDDWMMMPPTQDGLAARMDPTKLRARGFNTSKSAPAPKSDAADGATWFETPEQKRKRLQDQVLGVKPSSQSSEAAETHREKAKRLQDEEKARKIQKHNDEFRSQSLYEQRKSSSKRHEDDDPSKRSFNYEKDMSAAPRVSHAQKRDLLKKAGDFGSRFSKGGFL